MTEKVKVKSLALFLYQFVLLTARISTLSFVVVDTSTTSRASHLCVVLSREI